MGSCKPSATTCCLNDPSGFLNVQDKFKKIKATGETKNRKIH